MKKTIAIAFTMFTALPAFADNLFFVEPMVCHGIIEKKPRDMHDGYTQIVMKLESVKSTRRDGTLANTLIVSNDYFGSSEVVDLETDNFGEEWYMGPLRITDDQVVYKNGIGRDSNQLKLTVVNTTKTDGKTISILLGRYTIVGSVVGNYAYAMNCKAVVVDSPSKVIDMTVTE